MGTVRRLDPKALCARCDPEQLDFQTTDELPDLAEVIGQARAMEAIRFGLGIRRPGFNLYALGTAGSGRRAVLERFLAEKAAAEPVPHDWCYVNNFAEPHKPRVLKLPAGTGVRLRAHMEQLMEDLRAAIPAAFESEEYQARRKELEEEIKEQQAQALERLRAEAERHGIALIRTPAGMAFAPMRDGEVLSPDDFHRLPEEEQKRIEAVIATLEEQLEKLLLQVPQWRRQGQQRIRELDREITRVAVGHLIDELKREYSALPEVLAYLDAVQQDVIEHADDFRRSEEGPEITFLGMPLPRAAPPRPLLLTGAGSALRAPVLVIYEGSAAGARALALAATLARLEPEPLMVAIGGADAARLREAAAAYLAEQDVAARFRLLSQAGAGALVRPVETEGAGTLVLPHTAVHDEEELRALLGRLRCPALLVG